MQEDKRYEMLLLRVDELEKKVEYLRVSRRVLMNLVARIERDKAGEVLELLEENRRLKKANTRYAQTLWLKNLQIVELTLLESR